MSENKTIHFEGVEDTLFLPLAARVKASKRFPSYFYDKKSLELENEEHVLSINKKSSEYSMIASISRFYNFDKMVRAFLEKNPRGLIINLGVGLETMNYRLEETTGTFIQIDFPKVIKDRETILGKHTNEIFLPSDITDITWMEKIDSSKPILLIASGVFQYLKEEQVEKLIKDLKEKLPGSELIFDATDSVGVNYAQKYVKKTGNTSAMIYFYIDDEKEFCKKNNINLIEKRGFYDEARKQLKGLNLYTKIAMWVADSKGRTKLLHVKL